MDVEPGKIYKYVWVDSIGNVNSVWAWQEDILELVPPAATTVGTLLARKSTDYEGYEYYYHVVAGSYGHEADGDRQVSGVIIIPEVSIIDVKELTCLGT